MIAEIRLQQYRSYLDQNFKFSPGVNIIVGSNASGKTNLLEAVMVACQGSSFRASDNELIMHSKHWARIDAQSSSGPRSVKLKNNPTTLKSFEINNKPYKQLSLNNQLPVVLFEPNHLLMLSGSPELRRNYLDGILELTKPGYKKAKRDYLKTLRQRNALLKSGRTNLNELFPWNIRLSHLGGDIAASRHELVLTLNKGINSAYRALSNSKDKIALNYKSTVELDSYESLLLKKLDADYELDVLRGFTAHGPHREDLEILINKKLPSMVASRGEARTITIALKTLEHNIIKRSTGKTPIILLDDVFSELDDARSMQLTELMNNNQTIITAANLSSRYFKTNQTNQIRV